MTPLVQPSLQNPAQRAFSCTGQNSCKEINMYVSAASDVKSSSQLLCGGDYSCYNAGIYVDGDIGYKDLGEDWAYAGVSCAGNSACTYGLIRADESTLECNGYHSCANGNVAARQIAASGYLSLRQSTVAASYVQVTGNRAAEQAEISSGGADSLRVEMLGYAAGGWADVTCEDEQDGCTLVCV